MPCYTPPVILATAFAEVVVRDRLVQRDRRLVPFGDIAARGWVEFSLANDDPLNMVDLRETGCLASLEHQLTLPTHVIKPQAVPLVARSMSSTPILMEFGTSRVSRAATVSQCSIGQWNT